MSVVVPFHVRLALGPILACEMTQFEMDILVCVANTISELRSEVTWFLVCLYGKVFRMV